MQRKEAEKLLAALIFDDLDEASKTELLTYLQTDNELRERLADMRMAVKVASDTVQQGPDPVLGKRRLKRLARLARGHRTQTTIFTVPRLAAAAAIFIIATVGLIGISSLSRVRRFASTEAYERSVAYEQSHSESPADAPSRGEQATEITSREGLYTSYNAQVPVLSGGGEVIYGPIPDDGRIFAKAQEEIGGIAGAKISPLHGDVHSSVRAVPTEKWDSGSSFEGKLPGGTASREGLSASYNARPEVVDSIIAMNDENYFIKDKIGGITGAQTSVVSGDILPSDRSGSTERWDSASTWESKPGSGMLEDDDYVSRSFHFHSDDDYVSIDSSGSGGIMGRFPGGGMGMGGYGGGGYGGGMGGYGGGGYGGGMGMMGGGYSGNGFMSGDTIYGSHDSTINFKGIKNNLFTEPDASGIVADGDSIAVGGKVEFQNGIATGIKKEGLAIDSFDAYTDKFGGRKPVAIDAIKTVTVTEPELALPLQPMKDVSSLSNLPDIKLQTEGGESHLKVEDTKTNGWWAEMRAYDNEEVLRLRKKKEELATKSHQLIPENTKPLVLAYGKIEEGSRQDDASKEREAEKSSTEYSELRSRKESEKTITNALLPTDEIEAQLKKGQSTDYSLDFRGSGQKKESDPLAAFPGASMREFGRSKTGLTLGYMSDRDFSAPAEGLADKKESGGGPIVSKIPQVGLTIIDCDFQDSRGSGDMEELRGVPILGDIPIVGGLFRTEKKRPLTDEEKRRVVAYVEARKSQPDGEPAEMEYEIINLKHVDPRIVEDLVGDGFRDLSGTQSSPKVLIEPLRETGQIIVYGRKEQREAVKKMVKEIDNRRPQVRVDVKDVSNLVPVGEDEAELPPASRFKLVPVNPWVMSERDPFSTFALDVDTASYTLCRRYIRGGFLPPAGAVRMEEFVNNFNYQYPQRTNPTFKVHAEAAPSPFARKDQNLTLLKIGVKARTIGRDQRKAAHLIFVVDASASMGQPDRLPLVQQALGLLVNKLSAVDRVSLITCANEARLHLETIPARERDRIRQAIYAIQPAGSTNLLAGLKLGYATARRSFAPKQINHVVLCSDGVANVGQTEAEAVLDEVAADRKQGITITCVGVGYGSYNDAFMEALANRGDGSYMFLDSARQAHRVFVRQLAATLQTVARDARIQVDFNPNRVRRYRLIGYENRDIEDKRFRDDTIDAGEVGSGQCSTALYELELIGQPSANKQGDLGTVFVRYRNVETGQIEEISSRLSSATVRRRTVASAPRFFLAAGAARFAEMLRQSEHAQHGNMMDVLRVVEQVSLALPLDRDVRELAQLIRKAEGLPRSP